MTKFDFKQWVINNKYGKLNEQDARQRPRKGREMDMEMPPEDIGDFMPSPDDTSIDPIDPSVPSMVATACDPSLQGDCHAFSKCTAGHVDDGIAKNYITSMFGNPIDFWNDLGGPTSVGQHVRNTVTGDVFIYQGIQTLSLQNYSNTAPNGQNICGCNPGCNIQGATNYDPAATCNDGSCIMPPPEFSECQNCCCRSNLQAKLSPQDQDGLTKGNNMEPRINPDGGEFEYDMRENIDPTIDLSIALWEHKIEEQRRRPRFDRFDRRDREIEPIEPIEPGFGGSSDLPYYDEDDMIATGMNANNTGVMMGPCDASHYATTSTGQPVTQGTFTPDPVHGQIDPATGICECDTGDPNNTGLFGTLYSFMNPQPGTPNTTGAPNNTGPCP